MNAATVEDYAAALATAPPSPVVVFFDGERHWLADGFHPGCRSRAAGVEDVLARSPGHPRRCAVVRAVSQKAARAAMSNADKQRAVKLALAARQER